VEATQREREEKRDNRGREGAHPDGGGRRAQGGARSPEWSLSSPAVQRNR
jgi:hypothetical protein